MRDQDFELISQAGTDVTRENANLELNTSVGAYTLTMLAGMAKEDTFDWQADGSNLRCWEPAAQGQPLRGTGVCAAALQTYENREAEVRLASPVEARVQYLFGASYLEYESTWFGYQPLTGSAFFTVPADDVKSRSVYTAWSAEVVRRARLGLEARYTTDDLVTHRLFRAACFPRAASFRSRRARCRSTVSPLRSAIRSPVSRSAERKCCARSSASSPVA